MKRAHGTTIVELVIAVSIVGIALLVLLQQLSLSYRDTEINENRMFAWQKAMGILAELQAGIERGSIRDAQDLHDLDDGATRNPVLTTLRDEAGLVLPPDHPMSGNLLRGGDWLWRRAIGIEEVPMQPRMRVGHVRVWHSQPAGTVELMASVSGILNVVPPASPAVHEFDVYVLACGEVPSAWRDIATLRTTLEAAANELTSTSPSLRLRLHWITRLGYGRDALYVPDLNLAAAASESAPSAYWYPGTLEPGGSRLFDPDLFTGRLRVDGELRNDYDASARPWPHAIADRWNHCLRSPAAHELFGRRVEAGLEDPEQPPLQILLDQLGAQPERFRNAIFVNLHGDALAMPPLRNYSDAARDPTLHPGVRVVTHPARLCTPRDPDGNDDHADTEPLELRVYAYKSDAATGPAVMSSPITLCIPGFDLSRNVNGVDEPLLPATLEIRRLVGGVSPLTGLASGGDRDYAGFDSSSGLPPKAPVQPYGMYYEVGYDDTGAVPHTWIRLHNTPLTAPPVGVGGLTAQERPYLLEYIPSPVVAGGAFTRDLATAGTQPKNTARWRIRIPRGVFQSGFPGGQWNDVDTMVTVTTRIGSDVTTGRAWPTPYAPANLSTIYAWWAGSPAVVPVTEQYQWLGDPRHNPYADLVAGGGTFPHGYNWHFDDLRDGATNATIDWPAFDAARLADGFGAGNRADQPRYHLLLRRLLARSQSVFVQPAGAAGSALLLGGELCLPGDGPGLAVRPLALAGPLFGQEDPVLVDSVTPAETLVGYGAGVLYGDQLVADRDGWQEFWAKPWLGELWPDSQSTTWIETGTLPVPDYRRMLRAELPSYALARGTSFDATPGGAAAGPAGAVSLLGGGTLAATLVQYSVGDEVTSAPALAMQEIATAARTVAAPSLRTGLPFGIELPYPGALPHFGFTDSYPRAELTLLETLYDYSSPLAGAAIVRVADPDELSSGYYVLQGCTPRSGEEDTAVLRSALLGAVRAQHRAGAPGIEPEHRVSQLPLVSVDQPVLGAVLARPTSIALRWNVRSVRFDGQPYTSAYPGGFSEPEADLVYVPMYSNDEGATWRHVLGGSDATPGVRPSEPSLVLPDAATGTETYVWSPPVEQTPAGDYLLRIDCHDVTRRLHVGFHQTRFLITR